jgi:hypothetical protein
MYAEPKVISLDSPRNIYAIEDEKGKIAGTGTREVCEVMIYIIRKLRTTNTPSDTSDVPQPQRPNVRAALRI